MEVLLVHNSALFSNSVALYEVAEALRHLSSVQVRGECEELERQIVWATRKTSLHSVPAGTE